MGSIANVTSQCLNSIYYPKFRNHIQWIFFRFDEYIKQRMFKAQIFIKKNLGV